LKALLEPPDERPPYVLELERPVAEGRVPEPERATFPAEDRDPAPVAGR
jgi:hypothetical protein